MATYRNDPRWLDARYHGTCCRCGGAIKRGTRMFYYPIGKRTLCDGAGCGQEASLGFRSALFDEEGY